MKNQIQKQKVLEVNIDKLLSFQIIAIFAAHFLKTYFRKAEKKNTQIFLFKLCCYGLCLWRYG